MNIRTVSVGWLLMAAGCGPGTGGTTEDGSSGGGTTQAATGGATTTTGTPTTSEGSGGGTSGGTTGATTGTPTTGASTTAGSTSETGGSSGGPACGAVVGTQDCAQLVAGSGELTLEQCEACQGTPCGQVAECDTQFPCIDGKIVLQGCCTDAQCAGLTPFCGMFIGVDNVCVNDDDV